MFIPFDSYSPDLPDFNNKGMTVVKNSLPGIDSYLPFKDKVVFSNALESRGRGGICGIDYDANITNFAGTETKLYKLATATFSDVSKVGGYSTGDEDRWYMTQWKDQILATNFADTIQTWVLGTSTVFADLAGTPPKARYITTVRDFVVTGNTFDGVDGNRPNRVRWSGINDETSWAVSPSTQADFQDLDAQSGWVKQVIGGEYGTIFQERAITRMTYIGSPIVFQFDQVESDRGTLIPGSVVKFGNHIAYLGNDGFYAFNGQSSTPIGDGMIDNTVLNDLDSNYYDRVVSVVDPINKHIYWAYPGLGNTGGRPNRLLIFNYSTASNKRWSLVDIDVDHLLQTCSSGFTLEQLDSFGNLDTLQFSLDSSQWKGGNILLSAFDANFKMANFTGDALEATFETKEVELTPGRKTQVKKLRAMVEGSGTIKIQIGSRNEQTDSVTWSTVTSISTSGVFNVRVTARFLRVRVILSGGFTKALGINLLEVSSSGLR